MKYQRKSNCTKCKYPVIFDDVLSKCRCSIIQSTLSPETLRKDYIPIGWK